MRWRPVLVVLSSALAGLDNTTATSGAVPAAANDGGVMEWYLRDAASPGAPSIIVRYGTNECSPVVGDWDGDGDDTIGVYCDGWWFLRNSNTPGRPDVIAQYGTAAYRPIVGDWDGDGDDTIGVIDGVTWLLRDVSSNGPPTRVAHYGAPGYRFLAGDWNGDGADGIGVYAAGHWYLRDTTTSGSPNHTDRYGAAAYDPVAGDWDGDGDDTVGVIDGARWLLRDDLVPGPPKVTTSYGAGSYLEVAGDWDGDGDDSLGAVSAPYAASTAGVSAAELPFSWRSGCPIGPGQLRRLRLLHHTFDGRARFGELIVHDAHADRLTRVFARLFKLGYPIERMQAVDAFGGDDDASTAANNTSAFNCRAVTGGTRFSEHAYGWAIDVNPVQNPYVLGSTVLPESGRPYVDRAAGHPAQLAAGGPGVAAFRDVAGWAWGGTWTSPHDYQHFSATGR